MIATISGTSPFSSRVAKALPTLNDPSLTVIRNILAPIVKRALPPSVPQNFQVTNTKGGLKLSWAPLQRTSPSHGPDGYELLRSVDGSFTGDIQVIPIRDPQQTSYFDSFGSPTSASYRIRATAGSSSSPQSVRGPHSGVIRHTSLDPTDATSNSTTVNDNYTNDHVRSQSRFGNYGIAQYQTSPTIQSGASSGVGGGSQPVAPGTPPVAPGSVAFSSILGGSNTGQALVVGDGSSLGSTGTGTIDALTVNGVAITGDASTAALVPITQGDGTSAWQALVESDVTNLVTDLSTLTTAIAAETTRAEAAEALLAPLASPTLTGAPKAPTQTPLTNNTDIATTAYTDLAVGVENTRAVAAEALKSPIASPTFTGAVTLPTYVVASLPVGANGQIVYASNGRKVGEGAGSGTGVIVYFSNSSWRTFSGDGVVTA